jgi:hypothetical protein
MAEYSKASADESYWTKAIAMYDFLMSRLGRPSETAQRVAGRRRARC